MAQAGMDSTSFITKQLVITLIRPPYQPTGPNRAEVTGRHRLPLPGTVDVRQQRRMSQLLADQLEVPLQMLLVTHEVQRKMPQGVGEKIRLRGEMQLLADRFRVQPATDKVVEVAVMADQFLSRVIARSQRVASQKRVGGIGPLQRVANESEFETGGELLGKLLFVPVQRQVTRAPVIEQRRADAASGALGDMNEQTGALFEGLGKMQVGRH